MSDRPRRCRGIVPGLLTLVVLTSLAPTRAPAATDPRAEGPSTVSWPVQHRGDPDMPEGLDPRELGLDSGVRTRVTTAPLVRLTFWQALARRFGLAFGV